MIHCTSRMSGWSTLASGEQNFTVLCGVFVAHVSTIFFILKNKKDCADVYCVTLIESQAHCDAFIQSICSCLSLNG